LNKKQNLGREVKKMIKLSRINFWKSKRRPYEYKRTVQDYLDKSRDDQREKIDPMVKDASAICTVSSCACGLPSPN